MIERKQYYEAVGGFIDKPIIKIVTGIRRPKIVTWRVCKEPSIYPFIDGNGRTARLLLDFELMRSGYTPIIIKNEQKTDYYDVLDLAHTTMNYEPFIRLVAELLLESEALWLSVLE